MARKMGYSSESRYRKVEGKELSSVYPKALRALADQLSKTVQSLAEQLKPDEPEEERVPSNFRIRTVSSVAAGDAKLAFEVKLMNEEGVPGALYPEPMEDPMLLVVEGNSMSYDGPHTIEHGDMVLFGNSREEKHIPDGTIVVARVHPQKLRAGSRGDTFESSQFVKVLHRAPGNRVVLKSNNPSSKFKPIEVNAEEVTLRRVLFVIQRRMNWKRK